MIRRISALLLISGTLWLAHAPRIAALPQSYEGGSTSYDVSWPNCKATPPTVVAGIVGATGGLNFANNPCLATEATWFSNTSLYSNTGYKAVAAPAYAGWPKRCSLDDQKCLAYNWGYNAGRYAVAYAASQGVHAGIWWLDVETVNSWSDVVRYNRASIQGTYDAIKHYTVVAAVGVYAYPGQWDRLTDSWRPGWPAWAATGTNDRATAIRACEEPSFSGGAIWLTQYTRRLDEDYVCPR
jgi:hypothetical protein